MYEVKIINDWKDLPENLKDEYPKSFFNDSSVLVAYHNGKQIFEESDNGEPEDNKFSRDYAWVKKALMDSYELGREDGYSDGFDAGLETERDFG